MFDKPVNNGGAAVDIYKIEWAFDPQFKNIATSGYTHVLSGVGAGPFFCNIPITRQSSRMARYARVSAHNNRGWSVTRNSAPFSAVASPQLPGVPQNIKLEVTSHVGLLVSWEPPSSQLAAFGGNGGSPISSCVIEWDISDSFEVNVQRYYLELPSSRLGHNIGGRHSLTDGNSATLQPGVRYYVRVGAFNSIGAGTLWLATPASAVPVLQLPSPPVSSSVVPVDETTLKYSFAYPACVGWRSEHTRSLHRVGSVTRLGLECHGQ